MEVIFLFAFCFLIFRCCMLLNNIKRSSHYDDYDDWKYKNYKYYDDEN